MQFKKGDLVETLDDSIAGMVIDVEGFEILVEDKDGFVMRFNPKELVPQISAGLGMSLQKKTHEAALLDDQNTARKKTPTKKKQKSQSVPAIDLHIEKLVSSTKGMSNYDILNIQIEHAQRHLDNAFKRRQSRVVFIHGVGEGVLKMELNTLFRRYDNLQYYDADYRLYGYGATEVKIG